MTYKNSIAKYVHEYMFWKKRLEEKGFLPNGQYVKLFTEMFEVTKDFYTNKKILDIGCGPCGSLEWADNALQRVGLDPLAEAYEYLHRGSHKMEYIPDFVESISFPDEYFDVVVSINSLDHVDDLPKAISEIKRVVARGGSLFVAVEVSPEKKPCEPSPVEWDLKKHFADQFEIVKEDHYVFDGAVASSITKGEKYDHDKPQTNAGVLRLIMVRRT